MGFILFVIAFILILILGPLSMIGTVIAFAFTGQFVRLERFFYWIAYSIDQSGNVICQHLFNVCLIKKKGWKFGIPDETVSSVLGKNYEKGTLTFAGRCLERFLHFLDKDHSVDAIERDETRLV